MRNQLMQTADTPNVDQQSSARDVEAGSIEQMSSSELIALIRNANLPFLQESDLLRLPTLDRDSLERLVYLARQYSLKNREWWQR